VDIRRRRLSTLHEADAAFALLAQSSHRRKPMPRDWTPAEEANQKPQAREAEREQRGRDVASTIASLAIEGLKISPEAQTISDRYVDGEITVDEATAEILAWWDAKLGHASDDSGAELTHRRAADA